MSRCRDWKCEVDDKDTSIVQELKEWEKKYSFPRLWISVIAKSLDEARKKVKVMMDYKNKSI